MRNKNKSTCNSHMTNFVLKKLQPYLPSMNDVSRFIACCLALRQYLLLVQLRSGGSPNQGVDKLPPTTGAFRRPICRLPSGAQGMVIIPLTPDPFKLGWVKKGDGLFPVLSQVQAAVVELIHPVCRKMHLQESPSQVTDLCKFEGNEDCCNTKTAVINVDDLSKKCIFLHIVVC